MFCKKGALRNFEKFTGKHLRQSLYRSDCNFIKKETLAQVFSSEYCEISKNIFSYRTPPMAASVDSDLKIKLNGNRLYEAASVNYFGIQIDKRVRWKQKINRFMLNNVNTNAAKIKRDIYWI